MIDPLKNWQQWGFANKPICEKKFSEGENHHSWLIVADQQHWVIKHFEHSFDIATNNQQAAADLGIAPQIRYADDPELLMQFIANKDPARHHDHLHDIAKSLCKLHQAPLDRLCIDKPHTSINIASSFDIFAFAERYLTDDNELDQQWHKTLSPALEHFLLDQTPHCFCHNDLVLENIMIADDSVYFIDWEYAAINNPWFDLAAIILYAGLDESQSKEFLTAYKPAFSKLVLENIFVSSQISLLWLDLLWHSARDRNYRQSHNARYQQLVKLSRQFGLNLSDS